SGSVVEAVEAVADLDRATLTVSISDSDLYEGHVQARVPRGSRLVLVAATWPEREMPGGERRAATPGAYVPDGGRPHLRQAITVSGETGSSVVIDGLVVDGNLVVDPGDLESLTVAHCTITGRLLVRSEEEELNSGLEVRIVRSVVGRVELDPSVPLFTA